MDCEHTPNYSLYPYTGLFMQLSEKTIMWQQCNASNHADTCQLMFISNIRPGDNFDLSDFDRGRDCWWQTGCFEYFWNCSDLLGFSHVAVSRVFNQKGVKNKKTSSERQICGRNALLTSAISGECVDWLELTEKTQVARPLSNCGE